MSISLNNAQQQAVESLTGATMVIAGAGSGKTRVITHRVVNLIEKAGAFPHKIVALTFTNKAAKEMSDRIQQSLGSQYILDQLPFVGTFHGYCYILLKKYRTSFNLQSFDILDATDQNTIVKKILQKYNLEKELNVKSMLAFISSRKNKSKLAESTLHSTKLLEIAKLYEEEKQKLNALDFDDLLILVHNKLQNDKDFRAMLQSKISHVLIDEYQDTNDVQHSIIKLLALDEQTNKLKIDSIFAVGDQDQSIYSWRGAIVENVDHFLQDFAPVTLIKLEQNYRSTQAILNAANAVIKNNKKRQDKNLWSDNKSKNSIFIANNKNDYQQADAIAECVKKISHSKLGSAAILYRSHAQSRLLEESLIRQGVRYSIFGGLRFYERKEIKDLLSYLKFLKNKSDMLAFERIINCPARGLGDKFLEDFQNYVRQNQFTDLALALEAFALQAATRASSGIKAFLSVFKTEIEMKNLLPTVALRHILEKTNYKEYLAKEYEQAEFEEKLENIDELENSMSFFEKSRSNNCNFIDFLDEVALIQDPLNSESDATAQVVLMTLHSAKGLEFDNVFIVGLEEGLFPSDRQEEIEEERRLMYVGITRARKKLVLNFCSTKTTYSGTKDFEASRFILEIPEDLYVYRKTTSYFAMVANISKWLDGEHLSSQSISDTSLFSKAASFAQRSGGAYSGHYSSTPKNNLWQNNFQNKFSPQPISKPISSPKYTINDNSEFKPAMAVKHQEFGYGRVLKVYPIPGAEIVEVAFKTGVKKIRAAFLKKIDS